MSRILCLLIVVLLSGCSWVKTRLQPVIVYQAVPYVCGEAPAADPYIALPYAWQVLPTPTGPLFALTPQGYEALQVNLSKMLVSGSQVRDQRDFYKACIERSQRPDQRPDHPPPKSAPAPPPP